MGSQALHQVATDETLHKTLKCLSSKAEQCKESEVRLRLTKISPKISRKIKRFCVVALAQCHPATGLLWETQMTRKHFARTDKEDLCLKSKDLEDPSQLISPSLRTALQRCYLTSE